MAQRNPWHLHPFVVAARSEALRGGIVALIFALGLGFCLYVGANLSNAFPSRDRPFGWPGASSFDNGVAMVRPELLLAATVPGLVLGLRALRRLDPQRDDLRVFLGVVAADVAMVWLGALAAGGIGAWGADETSSEAYWAFCVAHALLCLTFYAIAVLWFAAFRGWGTAPALGVWLGYVVIYENFVRWKLFRAVGFNGVTSGAFPLWFYVAQALSPIALYRGVLILWRPQFRDYLEQAALGDAVLPAWMTAGNFALVMAVMWIVLPLTYAAGIWWIRHWRFLHPEGARPSGSRFGRLFWPRNPGANRSPRWPFEE